MKIQRTHTIHGFLSNNPYVCAEETYIPSVVSCIGSFGKSNYNIGETHKIEHVYYDNNMVYIQADVHNNYVKRHIMDGMVYVFRASISLLPSKEGFKRPIDGIDLFLYHYKSMEMYPLVEGVRENIIN